MKLSNCRANGSEAAGIFGVSGHAKTLGLSTDFSAEALRKFRHNLPIVSRILSSAKDFYFWQSHHIACTVNADSEREFQHKPAAVSAGAR
jgi:hypothetical protein